MAAYLEHWRSFSGSPVIVFVLLTLFTYWIYRHYFHYSNSSPTMLDGSIIMAVGIFAYACLPRFAVPNFFMLVVALELLAIWICVGFNLLQTYLYNPNFLQERNEEIALGIWITATVVTVLLLNQVEKTLHGFILMLSLAAIVLCAIYLIIVSQYMWQIIKTKNRTPANAMILLSAIGVESVVLLIATIFHDVVPIFLYQALIIFGVLLYFAGLCMMFGHALTTKNDSQFITTTEDCLIYASLAVTGLSMNSSGAFSGWSINAMWWSAFVAFLVVEMSEIWRLIATRGQSRHSLLQYDPRQWLRVFAFGMFYAFTLSCYDQGYVENLLVMITANYGQYIVAILLFMQIIIALYHVGIVRRG